MNPIRKAMENLPGHWHKGNTSDGKGNYCGLGHVDQVLCTGKYSGSAWDAVEYMDSVAAEQYPDRVTFETVGDSLFANFNDHPATTEEEVLRVMEKAAVEFESQVDFASGV